MTVVSIARGWLGTPYLNQGSSKGVGADCLGLIRGIWRELYGAEPENPVAYTADWGEGGEVEILLTGMRRHFLPVMCEATLDPGQVLLFRMRPCAIAKHLGVVSQAGAEPRFIHAYSGHGVIDSPLSRPWLGRIAGRFRFP